MGRFVNIAGQKFGKLTVLQESGRAKNGHVQWECKCECGNIIIADGTNLRGRHSESCGKCNTYYESSDGYMVCQVRDGREFIFDKEDYELVKQYVWNIDKFGYVLTNGYINKLHRLLLELTDENKLVDHINHNPSDNRRCNLRVCTQQQNHQNQIKTRGSSLYKGVYWNKYANKWQAQIKHNNKRIYLGLFTFESEAALAYNIKAKELFGEFANLNIIILCPQEGNL
jgi:hypothetical protein